MLIENGDAFDCTFSDFEKWAKKAGFKRTELIPLAGPTSAAIAYDIVCCASSEEVFF